MKVNQIYIEGEMSSREGFNPISLSKLGETVALVGKNGSGKSSFLRLVKNKLESNSSLELLNGDSSVSNNAWLDTIKQSYSDIIKTAANKNRLEALIRDQPTQQLKASLEKINSGFANNANKNARIAQLLQTNYRNEGSKIISSLTREIKTLDLLSLKNTDANSYEQLVKNSGGNTAIDLQTITSSALNYFERLKHLLVFESNSSGGDTAALSASNPYKEYIALKGFIKDFLNIDLTWEIDKSALTISKDGGVGNIKGEWKFNNRKFNYGELSPGQRILLGYSFMFFLFDINSEVSIRDCIIFIDEPELHLHPQYELQIVRGLKNVIKGRGQLWMATHSLTILSDLNYDEIYLIKDRKITPPNRQVPGKSLLELMELEENVERLQHFVTDISDWAYLGFTLQCLNNPNIVESAQQEDPQIEQFINSLREAGGKGVLLDFGAGKGRLFKELIKDQQLSNNLEYAALEPYSDNHSDLNQGGIKTIFCDYSTLTSESFDFIVLCNVLHEIKISEWEITLNNIIRSLKANGYIILIEDQAMPTGEKIEEAGYLILDQQAIQNLFSMSELPSLVFPKGEKSDRFLCALIKKESISAMNKESIKNALISLDLTTFKKIKAIKASTPDEKEKLAVGRKLAFYSQLCLNARHGLEILSAKPEGFDVPADEKIDTAN